MSSTELFRKHFGEQSAAVDFKHPNMEAFFNELNEECLRENEKNNMKEKYSYCTNDTDFNRCDIFEIGGEIVAKSVKWDLAEKIVDFLNSTEQPFDKTHLQKPK